MSAKIAATVVALALSSGVAFAQSVTTSTARIDQRQAKQQQRIDEGMKSGALTNQEAARLDRGQQHVQRMENRAVADGKVTEKERRRIDHAQDTQSRNIERETHDRQSKYGLQHGAMSTARIDKREVRQQQRIERGVKSGALTDKEAARLQKGEAHIAQMESKAAADGKVTPQERRRIAQAQDRQSKNIYREAHDQQRR